MEAWMDSSESELCLGLDCCEHGNEPPDCIKGWRFLDNVIDTIIKKAFSPHSYIINYNFYSEILKHLQFVPKKSFMFRRL